MRDVMRKVEEVALAERATRVTAVRVRLGALSHLTPGHFAAHFADSARGTVAEGASVDAFVAEDGDGVVLESVEVEGPR
jgi:hydrogenase nickel incorporation protein HypA/HybF